MTDAESLIQRWGMQRLQGEGGFFWQAWRSNRSAPDGRPAGTAILFLLTTEEFSALHRLDTDEVWHFHAGDRVEHVQIDRGGAVRTTFLGSDVLASDEPQVVVPAGTWQGAKLVPENRRGWALLGCTLAPGWDEKACIVPTRAELLTNYPAHTKLIERYTRASG
jgi:uncharacterized protein